MAKVKLALGAELDLLSQDELDKTLGKHGGWEREAAFGLRHANLPRLAGAVSGSGVLALGGDQPDGVTVGPSSGFYWSVKRLSVDGLQTGESVKVYKGPNFVCTISATPGFVTFGKGAFVLRAPDFLRLTGTGLTNNEQITMNGEYDSVPGPLMWKLLA